MKKIKNYLLSALIVCAPSLLLAHPGHEHHGTGMELFFHFLVTFTLIIGLGAGLFRLTHYFLRKKNQISNKHS